MPKRNAISIQHRQLGKMPERTGFDLSEQAAPSQIRGRGARSNASGRYEEDRRMWVDDGWGGPAEWMEDDAPKMRTEEIVDTSRTVIARNESPDLYFDRSVNPYRGCEHGCIYCFARPTHAYLGYSPGLDFETRILWKPQVAELLEKELRAKSYKCRTLAMGTNTDPYQPVERHRKLARSVLEVLERFNHPVGIVTKSDLILRDRDILGRMAEKGLVKVAISLTTLDSQLCRVMEPRASAPGRRLAALRGLRDAGVPVSVLTAPIIPALNEAEIEDLLAAAKDAGAAEAGYILLRLPLEIKDLFHEWLRTEVPDRAKKVMKLLHEMRGGRAYDSTYGKRMVGEGPHARLIGERFKKACARLGLNDIRASLDTSQFQVPLAHGAQMSLF